MPSRRLFFFSLFVFFPPSPQCHLLVSAEHRQEWRRNCGNWKASTRTRRERALQVLGEVGAHSQRCHPCQGERKSHLWSAPVAVILLPAALLLSKIRTFCLDLELLQIHSLIQKPLFTNFTWTNITVGLRLRCQRLCSCKHGRMEAMCVFPVHRRC